MIPDKLSSEPPYLQGMNERQQEAARALDGPVLIIAGAGTGKTRVLTTRLAYLLQSGRAFPGQILAVTFTNKAAHEMKERVSHLLGGQPVEGWWLGTFHALCARMLRRHAELVGLTSSFTIIDQDDAVRLIKQICEAENIDLKKWPPRLILSMIERWKDRALRPEDVNAADAPDFAQGRLLEIYRQYHARLKTINACDFGDLMMHIIHILRTNQDVLADYHRRFKYIMVDEYQDTNVAQYLWLRLLAQGSNNICCVGDDDQSIYGWRGAEVGNILRFEKDFPGAKIVRLEQNYRSTGHILAAASGVIAQNKGRLGKTLWSQDEMGEKVFVRSLWDGEAEARFVGEEMESLQNKKWKLRQMAVLVRAGFQMREFEERFIQLGLNYKVFGGPRFYERQEIRDALAYFRVTVQPNDDLAFERIINVPKRGIGDATVQSLYAHARRKGLSLYLATAELCETDALKPKVRTTLLNLIRDFERWRSLLSVLAHPSLAGQILDESGYTAMWQADKTPEAPGRLENLKELVSGMEEFESMPQFLEHVALVLENSQNNANDDYVSLMTLHGAKGLEFDAVFLAGWEEGLFPSQRTMDENGIAGLEEERRLAYVGITRARKRAYITSVANRRMYGNWVNAIPSRFVDELPKENIESEQEQGMYNAGRSSHWDSKGFDSPMAGFRGGQSPVLSGWRRDLDSRQSKFNVGDRVFHDSFGGGTVILVEGKKLDVSFDDGENRRVMDGFVESIT
ncbi:MAG: DNA helicase II [Micavibrio aeruginosavorus]|uniref:DNA 3'-5' helicase n=1 Tax=Micavibrio aeruginosavorus TaxID=349221 RepID=A0A2W5FIZ2_9BACT|nr:MAG: DNA helicase II [Micavibrio aeruginosavorus]